MKLPRNLSGDDLVAALGRLGYRITHRSGSHVRLTTTRNGEHHVSVPAHPFVKIGTVSAILKAVGLHHELERDEWLRMLFD